MYDLYLFIFYFLLLSMIYIFSIIIKKSMFFCSKKNDDGSHGMSIVNKLFIIINFKIIIKT